MNKICRKCGYYIDEVWPGTWVDCYDDDACYDDNLTMQGNHEPEN